MPHYFFQAVDRTGHLVNGKVEAADLESARGSLSERAYLNIRFLRAFVFKATGPSGLEVAEEIEAENLEEAKALLASRGYSRVRFLDGENIESIRHMVINGSGLAEKGIPRISPAEEISSRGRRTLRHKVLWAIGKHMVYLGPLLLWNAVTLMRAGPIRPLGIAGLVATPVYLVWMIFKLTPMVCFHQIMDANVWKDWRRMRRFIGIARGARRILGMGIPEFEMMTREAYALASEGRLPEALTLMERVRTTIPVKPRLFLGRLATVYQHAGDFDRQQACMLEAMEAGQKRSVEWIDYGTFLARHERDLSGAKAALAEAEKFEMSQLAKAGFARCSGMIALAERDYPRAHGDLRNAVAGLTQHASTPIGEFLTSETKAYLAIACARLGRRDGAGQLWAEVEPLMKARGETWLIEHYAEAAGGPPLLN